MENKKTSYKGKIWLKNTLKPYRASIIFLAVLAVITTLCSLAFAVLVRYLINSASVGNKQQLLIFSVIVLCVLLLKIALKAIISYLSERERGKMDVNLRKKLFSQIIRSDYLTIQSYHSGELMNRLTTDIQEISVDSVGLMQAVSSMIVQCAGAIVALMTIDPYFTLIYILGGLLIFLASTFLRKFVKKYQREYLEAEDNSRSYMQEGLSSILTLKAYNAEEKANNRADLYLKESFKKRMSRNKLRTFTSVLFSVISNIGMIFAVIWCSVSVLKGNEDYGSILSIILLLMQLQQPFSSFSGIMPVIYSRLTSAERLNEIEEIHKENNVLNNLINCDEIYSKMHNISGENLTFSYGKESIFDSADFNIKKGSIVCITGQSGSGKSTLFRLLLNVLSPEKGQLLLNLDENEKINLNSSMRKLFAYVPQGNFLFSGTIRENLMFFAEDESADNEAIGEDMLKKALEISCCDFVEELPLKLETVLTEGGGGLSEGQLQRIAVARAIISQRPVLLLDEATSALDGETEEKMLLNISKLQNRTCLIVTHRPKALEIAHEILNVENGKIIKIK